jgi:hypothetical protein
MFCCFITGDVKHVAIWMFCCFITGDLKHVAIWMFCCFITGDVPYGCVVVLLEECEDTKGVIRIRK